MKKKMPPPPKNKIIWLLQPNQVTPTIHNFIALLKTRMEALINLTFMVPETASDLLEKLKDIVPGCYKTSVRSVAASHQGYLAKRAILDGNAFSMGLSFTDVLLADDLGGGNVIQTTIDMGSLDNVCGLFIQIPTPLGSSESEEQIFHAAVMMARQNHIPIVGYELLPLDTRWTLAASLPDGILTRSVETRHYLHSILPHNNIWALPWYEGAVFSPVSDSFNINGAKASYHYRSTLQIPEGRTVIFLPHNVGMIHEYHELLKIIAEKGPFFHLMFNFGDDQVRGTHTHIEMIELIYKNELQQVASYSFHNSNNPWEMLMADSVITCSTCFHTVIAREKNIPAIIFEPMLPPATSAFTQRISTPEHLLEALQQMIDQKQYTMEFGTLFMQLAAARKHDTFLEK
jgi:hypothetical protein